MNMTKSTASPNGFSLIEVLVALFILAVGILGIIALQLFAKQNNTDAIQRTTAAALATNIAERMRMNSASLVNYISEVTPIPPDSTMPYTCDAANSCSSVEIAVHDLAAWHALISGAADLSAAGANTGGLTEPSACIIQNPLGTNEREYRIVIAWRGRTPLTNPVVSTCGEDAAGERYGANNEYRRIYLLDARL